MEAINRYTVRHVFYGLWLIILTLSYSQLASSRDTLTLRQHIEGSTAEYPLSAFGIPLKMETSLQEFYLQRNFVPAWFDGSRRPTPQALAIIDEISRIASDGLLPNDYHFTKLASFADADTSNYVQYDMLLSNALATLSQHLLIGKVDPESLFQDWSVQRRHQDLTDILEKFTKTDDVAAAIDQLRPNQVRYYRLKKQLERLRANEQPEWPALALSPAIKPGTKDPRIMNIRQRLIYWADLKYSAIDEADALDDDLYTLTMKGAIQNFQRRHGLEEDGVIGKLTLEALNISPMEREKQIVNNLERWRWLTADLGEKYVLVNIASFELRVIDNGQTIMRKPVIVGRDYRRTPVFSDTIRYLVFNPTWTVPSTIAVKDKLPEIRKDPTYLSRLGYTLYDSKQTVVDPSKVDWKALSGRSFPYRMVQAPGPLNALGQVKFMFPNPYDVYLHDTPARELFSKKERAFSSGCVRVSNPLELAAWLLKDNGIGRQQIDDIVAKGALQTIFLKKPIPVHIEYWTAWIDSQEELHFRNDIYQRDPTLTAALAAPLYEY